MCGQPHLQHSVIRITVKRMTRFILTLSVLLLGVVGFVLPASGQSPQPPRFVVVVDESAGPDDAAVDAATRAVKAAHGADAQLRITRTPTEQLSVTSHFAARGYAVVGVGLDEAVAVDPVAERYPSTPFHLTDARGIDAAVSAAR
jgi:ABC-type sugar transport system substrate-binding protein